MRVKAKDLKIGHKVVVCEFGRRFVYELISFKEFPKLPGPGGSAFIAVGTNEWQWGVPGLGGTFDLEDELEIEEQE